jgi:rod shape-determining protein MreD
MHIKSRAAFWIALSGALFGPLLLPRCHLYYFAPYFVVCAYQHSKLALLWRAYLCGVILDLLSSTPFFGLSSLNYCLASWLLYGQTRNFFEDKLSTLPLMTFLFSLLSTLIALILAFFFAQSYPLSCAWMATDLVIMPLADSIYALLVFSLPFQLTYKLRKMRLFS